MSLMPYICVSLLLAGLCHDRILRARAPAGLPPLDADLVAPERT